MPSAPAPSTGPLQGRPAVVGRTANCPASAGMAAAAEGRVLCCGGTGAEAQRNGTRAAFAAFAARAASRERVGERERERKRERERERERERDSEREGEERRENREGRGRGRGRRGVGRRGIQGDGVWKGSWVEPPGRSAKFRRVGVESPRTAHSRGGGRAPAKSILGLTRPMPYALAGRCRTGSVTVHRAAAAPFGCMGPGRPAVLGCTFSRP
jgi:hypothetical protein